MQVWTAKGRGNRQMCGTNAYGFPIRHRARRKVYFGFQTGEWVQAIVPRGKYAGTHTGRVLVRAHGRFDMASHGRRVFRINTVVLFKEGTGGSISKNLFPPNGGNPLSSPGLKAGASRGLLVTY